MDLGEVVEITEAEDRQIAEIQRNILDHIQDLADVHPEHLVIVAALDALDSLQSQFIPTEH